jgi:hypothetical protein
LVALYDSADMLCSEGGEQSGSLISGLPEAIKDRQQTRSGVYIRNAIFQLDEFSMLHNQN